MLYAYSNLLYVREKILYEQQRHSFVPIWLICGKWVLLDDSQYGTFFSCSSDIMEAPNVAL